MRLGDRQGDAGLEVADYDAPKRRALTSNGCGKKKPPRSVGGWNAFSRCGVDMQYEISSLDLVPRSRP
jgi:hypothetical protein